jgi:hypothetical protein
MPFFPFHERFARWPCFSILILANSRCNSTHNEFMRRAFLEPFNNIANLLNICVMRIG